MTYHSGSSSSSQRASTSQTPSASQRVSTPQMPSALQRRVVSGTENLIAKQGELMYPSGEEYPAGARYHMHPDRGPMEGAFHVSTPHSVLIYTNEFNNVTTDYENEFKETVTDFKITNIELDYSDIKQSGEKRSFKIIGDNGAKFRLEIKNEDASGSYYNFYTNSFSSTYSFLEEEIKNGFYQGTITFPAVTDDDHYDISLFALENTKHSSGINKIDYLEIRFGDGSIDINSSSGSTSSLLQKIIYQYTSLTLTMSAYSSSGGVAVHAQGTDTITVDRGGKKELSSFSFTVTAPTTSAYRILKQPEADDLVAYVQTTVGSVGLPLPGEDIFTRTPRSTDQTADGGGSPITGTVVTMDVNCSTIMAIGDRVTGNAALDAKTGLNAVTVTEIGGGVGNAKKFTVSESVDIADNETLSFTEPSYKRWEINTKGDIIKEGMIILPGTNIVSGTNVAEYEDFTLINENTKEEEKIRSKVFQPIDTKYKKPTITNGVTTTQEGEIIFDTSQPLSIASTTLKIGGNGIEEVFRLHGYDVEVSELAIALTETSTTTTEASAGGSSADIAVTSREGVINNFSRIKGIGINPALQSPLVTSGGGATGGGDWTMDAVQTLENGITLTVENTSRVATISGKIKINKVGTEDQTLRFELDNLISTSAPS